MSAVEVLDVIGAEEASESLAHVVEAPTIGEQHDAFTIQVRGWVAPVAGRVVAVEAVDRGRTVAAVAPSILRPDVGAAIGRAGTGFSLELGTVGLPVRSRVSLRARMDDERTVPLATLLLRRRALRTSFRANLQPLVVTTVAGTGSTWFMHLLDAHPGIAVHPFERHEMRAGQYWMHMLTVLAEPERQAFLDAPARHFHLTDHLGAGRWFTDTYLTSAAAFCQRSLEDFYLDHLRRAGGSEAMAYFAETHAPCHTGALIAELYPDAREIVLVRDFRDVVCSIRPIASSPDDPDGAAGIDAFIDQLGVEARSLLDQWRPREHHAQLVRYEDLVTNPIDTLAATFEYLGLDARSSTLERIVTRLDGTAGQPASPRSRVSPASAVGRWAFELEGPVLDRCEAALGPALAGFGYGSADGKAPTRSVRRGLGAGRT